MSAALPPIPCEGVTLQAIINLQSIVRRINADWTTEEVNSNLIKKWTETDKCSLTGLLKRNYRYKRHPELGLTYNEAVGKKATIFVSHAWLYKFIDVVDVIIRYIQCNREGITDYLWFDLFVNDQWRAGELPFEWWTNTFISSVQSIGHTLLVMLPLHAPICLTRAWCIFEIYSSICHENTKFSLGISQNDITSALERVQSRDQMSAELASIISFDTRLSQCGKVEDRVRIHEVVSGLKGGFEEMNKKIANLLVKLLNEQLSQTHLMTQQYLKDREKAAVTSTVWKKLIKV